MLCSSLLFAVDCQIGVLAKLQLHYPLNSYADGMIRHIRDSVTGRKRKITPADIR